MNVNLGDKVLILNGPYAMTWVRLKRTPPAIQIGEDIYTQVLDPDTGEFLNAYAKPYLTADVNYCYPH